MTTQIDEPVEAEPVQISEVTLFASLIQTSDSDTNGNIGETGGFDFWASLAEIDYRPERQLPGQFGAPVNFPPGPFDYPPVKPEPGFVSPVGLNF